MIWYLQKPGDPKPKSWSPTAMQLVISTSVGPTEWVKEKHISRKFALVCLSTIGILILSGSGSPHLILEALFHLSLQKSPKWKTTSCYYVQVGRRNKMKSKGGTHYCSAHCLILKLPHSYRTFRKPVNVTFPGKIVFLRSQSFKKFLPLAHMSP